MFDWLLHVSNSLILIKKKLHSFVLVLPGVDVDKVARAKRVKRSNLSVHLLAKILHWRCGAYKQMDHC